MHYADQESLKEVCLGAVAFICWSIGMGILYIVQSIVCLYCGMNVIILPMLIIFSVIAGVFEFARAFQSEELLRMRMIRLIGRYLLVPIIGQWRLISALICGWTLRPEIKPEDDMLNRFVGFDELDRQILQCLHEKGAARFDEIWVFLERSLSDYALQDKLDSLQKRKLLKSRAHHKLPPGALLYRVDPDVRPLLSHSHPPANLGNLVR